MIRRLTAVKREARREANHSRVMPIYERGAALIPADYFVCHQSGGSVKSPVVGHSINGNPASFVRIGSRVARWFESGNFKIRDVTYERMKDGSVRAHGKPRSRVKRLRELRQG
jgi:hypothetical protein